MRHCITLYLRLFVFCFCFCVVKPPAPGIPKQSLIQILTRLNLLSFQDQGIQGSTVEDYFGGFVAVVVVVWGRVIILYPQLVSNSQSSRFSLPSIRIARITGLLSCTWLKGIYDLSAFLLSPSPVSQNSLVLTFSSPLPSLQNDHIQLFSQYIHPEYPH